MRLSRNRTSFAVLVVALALGAGVVGVAVTHTAGAAVSTQAQSLAASHGPFGGTAALSAVTPVGAVPEEVARSVQRLADFDHTDAARAAAAVRLARDGAGAASRIYAFNDDRGNPCIVVVDFTLFCDPDEGTGITGLNWSIGGGDSRSPSRFIAVYSDDVAGIALTVDGTNTPVSMSNNIAYATFPTTSSRADFTVTYVDGSQRTISTNLQG